MVVNNAECLVHMEFDDTMPADDKHTVLYLLGMSVVPRCADSVSSDGSRVGHAHEETDHYSGELAKHNKQRLHALECWGAMLPCMKWFARLFLGLMDSGIFGDGRSEGDELENLPYANEEESGKHRPARTTTR